MIIKDMAYRIDEARDAIKQLEELVDELERNFLENLEAEYKNASHE